MKKLFIKFVIYTAGQEFLSNIDLSGTSFLIEYLEIVSRNSSNSYQQ